MDKVAAPNENIIAFDNTRIFRFAAICLLVYGSFLFTGKVLNFDKIYGDIYRNKNTALFETFFKNSRVTFKDVDNHATLTDIYLKYTGPKQWTFATYRLDAWYLSYIPVALVLSLFMATKYASNRIKFYRFVAGFSLTSLLLLFILAIRIYTLKIEAQQVVHDFHHTGFDRVMIFFHNNVAAYGWINYVIPVLVWFTLNSFSNEKIKVFINQKSS